MAKTESKSRLLPLWSAWCSTARGLARGDRVSLYPLDSDESVTGSVHQKSAIAARKTRTHKVSLFLRNRRVAIRVPPGGPAQSARNSAEYRGAKG